MRSLVGKLLVLATGAVCLAAFPAASLNGQDPLANGVFRFVTQSLPEGSTNTQYLARVLVANAHCAVVFSVDVLPPGLNFDPTSGFITGRPSSTFNSNVMFTADDGVEAIALTTNLKVNAAGGGGNAGVTVTTTTLADATVAEAFTETIQIEGGVGPFVFGATSVPAGLSLNGLTGVLSGTPISPGAYAINLSVFDKGENNRVITVLPITVFPNNYGFEFNTLTLNNGEVATGYVDSWDASGGDGNVFYSASGLPIGLSIDSTIGMVTGSPMTAGTYEVFVAATDSNFTIVMQQAMVVLPSETSNFHWNYFGVPAALVNESYDRQPPILIAAANGAIVTYTVSGLPASMSYDLSTGELSGTPTEIGEYPVTFTAEDAGTGETIALSVDFVVLPPDGGDASALAVNFWIVKEKLKTGSDGADLWKAKCIYNADRRAGSSFSPTTDSLVFTIGSRTLTVDPGSLAGTAKKYTYTSVPGVTPIEVVKISPAKQTIDWVSKKDTLPNSVPGLVRQTTTIGNRSYRLEQFFDLKGVTRPTLDYRRAAFVVSRGKITVAGGGRDSIKLSLLLADPTFGYEAGVDTLRVRLLNGAEVLCDRDFTDLGSVRAATDRVSGASVYTLKNFKDGSTADRLKKFVYKSATGKMTLVLTDLTLPALPADEAHLGAEVTIGDKTYFTAVTFFALTAGKYSTTMR